MAPVAWWLGPVRRTDPVQIDDRLAAADAIIGLTSLHGYRLTIDYPGSRLWLERN